MTQWERVSFTAKCGECGAILADSTPMLTIQLSNVRRKLIRCQTCAGPAPPDLPLAPVRYETRTKRMSASKVIAQAVVDKWLPYRD